jgi:hypothetical protein
MSLVLFSYFSIVRLLVNDEYLYALRHNHSNIHTIQKTYIFFYKYVVSSILYIEVHYKGC